MQDELKFLEFVSSRLAGAGVPYMLTGSMAMMFYAVPRMTRDIDLVVECHAGDIAELLAAFGSECYISESAVREAVSRRGMFNIIHTEWAIKADFVVRRQSEYRELEFSRRREMPLSGFSIAVVSPEDLVLSKLDWARESRSESQYRDVAMLLEAVPDLDFVYLEIWAAQLDVSAKLNELRPV